MILLCGTLFIWGKKEKVKRFWNEEKEKKKKKVREKLLCTSKFVVISVPLLLL